MKPKRHTPAARPTTERAAPTAARVRTVAPRRGVAYRAAWLGRLWLAMALVPSSALAAEPSAAPEPAAEQVRATSGDQRVVQLNEEGSALYAAGDYRRAVELFIQAYAVDQDPNLLFNIGSCYEGLGDAEAALEKYRAFLGAPNADPEGRPRAERAIERLTRAAVTPEPEARPTDPPAEVVTSPPPPVPSEAGPPAWAGWVGLGGGAALGAAGAALYLLGAADHADVTSADGYGDSGDVVSLTRAEARARVRSGDTKKAVGFAAAATGGALLTGYLVWWLLDRPSGEGSPTLNAAADESSARVSFAGTF